MSSDKDNWACSWGGSRWARNIPGTPNWEDPRQEKERALRKEQALEKEQEDSLSDNLDEDGPS